MEWLTCTGDLAYDSGVDRARLLEHLAAALRTKNAREIVIRKGSVSFRGGIFRMVMRSNVLNAFHHGELIVDASRHRLIYRLNIAQLVTGAAILLSIAAIAAMISPASPREILLAFVGIPALVAISIVIDLERFRWFLRSAIDSLPPPS